MQASMGQYSMQAGEPAQPVQQSVVIASIRGLFLRVALPSPRDIGHCLSTISNTRCLAPVLFCCHDPDRCYLNTGLGFAQRLKIPMHNCFVMVFRLAEDDYARLELV